MPQTRCSVTVNLNILSKSTHANLQDAELYAEGCGIAMFICGIVLIPLIKNEKEQIAALF